MASIQVMVSVLFLSLAVNALPPNALLKPSYKLYSRTDWRARPATDLQPIDLPVPYVVIHHTYIPRACPTFEVCSSNMRGMQNYHMGLDWGDIGYNFCVGSEGGAYEGRGWDYIGIHARSANNYSIGICLIGDWRAELPPEAQLETTKALIADGVRLGKISRDYKLVGHNQVTETECPGTALATEISTWDHYTPGVPVMTRAAVTTSPAPTVQVVTKG